MPPFVMCPTCENPIDISKLSVEWFLLSDWQKKVRIASTMATGLLYGISAGVILPILLFVLFATDKNDKLPLEHPV